MYYPKISTLGQVINRTLFMHCILFNKVFAVRKSNDSNKSSHKKHFLVEDFTLPKFKAKHGVKNSGA